MREQARAALIVAMGWSLVQLYLLVRPFEVIILLGILAWSLVKEFVTVTERACAIYRTIGAVLWLLQAFWSLPFQLIITPIR